MATKIDYQVIIDDIEKSNKKIYVLDQKQAKKLVNNDLPKSLFNNSYIKGRKNDLARYLSDNCDYEVTEPKIIIKKK